MGLYSEDGKLMIDEEAAKRDIQKIEGAIEKLQASESALKSMRDHCQDMEGLAAQAMLEKINEKLTTLNNLIVEMRNVNSYIRGVIKKYEEMDAEIARRNQNAANALKDTVDAAVKGVGSAVSNATTPIKTSDSVIKNAGGGVARAVKNMTDKLFG